MDASKLDDCLETLISEDAVICPAQLNDVISRNCDWLVTQVIFYDGKLWLVDDERDLPAPYNRQRCQVLTFW